MRLYRVLRARACPRWWLVHVGRDGRRLLVGVVGLVRDVCESLCGGPRAEL
jgi:hypothetical protein